MAVQVGKMDRSLLHVDIAAVREIVDKVGAHPLTVIAANGLLQRAPIASEEVGQVDQPSGLLMWPEPFVVSHNGQDTAVLLVSAHGALEFPATAMHNYLESILLALLPSGLIYRAAEDMLQDVAQEGQQLTGTELKALVHKWAGSSAPTAVHQEQEGVFKLNLEAGLQKYFQVNAVWPGQIHIKMSDQVLAH